MCSLWEKNLKDKPKEKGVTVLPEDKQTTVVMSILEAFCPQHTHRVVCTCWLITSFLHLKTGKHLSGFGFFLLVIYSFPEAYFYSQLLPK